MKTFEEIYKSYSADIYRFAMFKLRNRSEAEDVVSETFTRFMEKDNQKDISDLKLWLLGCNCQTQTRDNYTCNFI